MVKRRNRQIGTDIIMTTAVYHWWNYSNETPAYANLSAPIVLAIACLRSVSDVPIIVLDVSDKDQEWGHFPDKLNFSIVKINPYLSKYKNNVAGWRYLSRFFDLNRHVQTDTVMYVDSDVFWFKNPLPFLQTPNKMCINPWNSGFFYYQPTKVKHFFHLFESYAMSAIFSGEIRNVMQTHIDWKGWYGVWDEMILKFMHDQNPELINRLSRNEHSITCEFVEADIDNIKMWHLNGLNVSNYVAKNADEQKHSRGLVGLTIKEFHSKIIQVLSESDLRMIYSQNEIDYYLPMQVSIFQNLDNLHRNRMHEGHFILSKCLKQPSMLI